MLDVNEIRDRIVSTYGLPNVDGEYTFYYDETNNVRKLHLTPDGMNIRSPECFVLGGVLHPGGPRVIELATLRTALRLQANIREIKLMHIASGGFLDMLRSARLGALLEWLTAERLLVHYQVTDLLYWSIVDIVDSILAKISAPQLSAIHFMLKDSLRPPRCAICLSQASQGDALWRLTCAPSCGLAQHHRGAAMASPVKGAPRANYLQANRAFRGLIWDRELVCA